MPSFGLLVGRQAGRETDGLVVKLIDLSVS